MKYIFLLTLLAFEVVASVIKSPLLSVDDTTQTATIKIDKIDVGVTGFAVHSISKNNTVILKKIVVSSYDSQTKIATLKLSDFNDLINDSLPSGKWKLEVGDIAELAFGYSRAIFIAPSEVIYHKITKSVKTQWVHIDIFAAILSYRGHPTPLKEDFEAMSAMSGVGLLFIYLDERVYTVDIKSFKILDVSDVKLTQDTVKLPFYSRVEEISANLFGTGNDDIEEYEPYYYELLAGYNKRNVKLYDVIKNGDKKLHHLLDDFEIGK